MRTPIAIVIAALLSPIAIAQDATPLEPGVALSGTLTDAPHTYEIDLQDDTFVLGHANQLSVDLVLKIFSPQNRQLAQIDGPAEGPERFQFDTNSPGIYRIEVHPFEDDTGDYTIEISRAEPIATSGPARVDQLMANYDNEDTPGGVVGVLQGGKLIFARAYGMADLSHNIPFEIDTRTNIGSTTKQFTAFALCLLDARGELSLDDSIRTHIPSLPEHADAITLRHLLTHTSGFREFLNFFAFSGRQLGEGDLITRDEIVKMLERQPELQNEPGAEWNYNNSGYALATLVVEKVTDKPFGEWMDENVFTPLHMHDTFVRPDRLALIERKARGYSPAPAGHYREAIDLGGAMGAGGIYTTVEDLAKWINNLDTGALGGKELIEQMTTKYTLNNGEEAGYALGLFIDEQAGLLRIQHGGADTAHRSMIMYFPEIHAGVITQSNNASFDGTISNKVAEAFFAEHMDLEEQEPEETEESAEFDLASFNPESFDAFAGRYELEEVKGFIMTFTREDDKYFAQATGQPKFELTPTSPNTFKLTVVEASVEFQLEDDGSCKRIILHQNGEHPANRVEQEPWSPSEEQLAAYTGRFFSKELETFYDLTIDDGKIKITHRRFEVTLQPYELHRFQGGFPIAELKFIDEGNVITGFTVANGRTRDVHFKRVE